MLRACDGATAERVVTLYGRPGCGLCEEAAEWLRRWSAELRFRLNEVDIDRDPALLAAYDWVVPVVIAGALELARAPLSRATLRRRLQEALAG